MNATGEQDMQKNLRGAVLMVVAHGHQSRVLDASLPSDVLARLGSIKFNSWCLKLRLLFVLPQYLSESRVIKITMLIESRISTP